MVLGVASPFQCIRHSRERAKCQGVKKTQHEGGRNGRCSKGTVLGGTFPGVRALSGGLWPWGVSLRGGKSRGRRGRGMKGEGVRNSRGPLITTQPAAGRQKKKVIAGAIN